MSLKVTLSILDLVTSNRIFDLSIPVGVLKV